jgi:hypothetical protein
LARSRSWQELTERDEIGIALVVEPAAPLDEFIVEIAEMRDWAAE